MPTEDEWTRFLVQKCGFDPASASNYAQRLTSNNWSFEGLDTLMVVADDNIAKYAMLVSEKASGGLGMTAMSHQLGLLNGIRQLHQQSAKGSQEQLDNQASANPSS